MSASGTQMPGTFSFSHIAQLADFSGITPASTARPHGSTAATNFPSSIGS
jgi:hypothetical protein